MFSYLIWLIVFFVLNLVVSLIIGILIPNYYLASIVTSVVIAFLYALLSTFDKKHFYKDRYFWIRFFGLGIIFLLVDWIGFMI